MTNPDLPGRTPTVIRYRRRWPSLPSRPALPPLGKRDAKPTAVPRPPNAVPARSPLFSWLGREAIALLGIAGAALTVLGQIGWHMPLAPVFLDAWARWMTWTGDLWRAIFEAYGWTTPHLHMQAAMNLAVCLALIGLGARLSARAGGGGLESRWGLFHGLTVPSMVIFAALIAIFLYGYEPAPGEDPLDTFGSGMRGQYAFTLTVAAGYVAGDFLGQKGFHVRLYRLALVVALLLGLNRWLLTTY